MSSNPKSSQWGEFKCADDWLEANWKTFVISKLRAAAHAKPRYMFAGGGSGVYVMMDGLLRRCVYVGSSVNLSNRLRCANHKMPEEIPTFAFHVPEALLGTIEAAYYSALSPVMNMKCPAGDVCATPIEMIPAIRHAWGIAC
jgi:hypothetical protein